MKRMVAKAIDYCLLVITHKFLKTNYIFLKYVADFYTYRYLWYAPTYTHFFETGV